MKSIYKSNVIDNYYYTNKTGYKKLQSNYITFILAEIKKELIFERELKK